jgi:tetratricopeptide (TPR) repeat protein
LLAERQHDLDAAADYARRAVLAGENEVRFNPSDIGAWGRWAISLRTVSDVHFARGEIAQALAAQSSVLALEQDKRRPASLGPTVWYQWITLAVLQAETGDMAAATASMDAFRRDTAELSATVPEGDPRRTLLDRPTGVDAIVQLIGGSAQTAYAGATKEIEHVQSVDTPARSPGQIMKTNILRSNLATAAQAGVRSGHAREAEAFAKQLLEVPATSTSEADPRERRAHANAIRAHAIAMQGRSEEALEVLAPALEYYRGEEKAGASATYFRYDFAYALTVSAISRSDKAGQRAQRNADLDEATRVLDGASSEAKRMASFRELATLIAATRG